MKTLLSLFLFTTLTNAVHAQVREKLIYTYDTTITVKVDANTLRCSAVGYSFPELKIDVPALDVVALLQHRNFGEGQPCMTAGGRCDHNVRQQLLADGEGEVTTLLTVTHKEAAYFSQDGTCSRDFVEVLKMNIRGVDFHHTRTAHLGDTTAAACAELFPEN